MGDDFFLFLVVGVDTGPANPVLFGICFQRTKSCGQPAFTPFYGERFFFSFYPYWESVCYDDNLHCSFFLYCFRQSVVESNRLKKIALLGITRNNITQVFP